MMASERLQVILELSTGQYKREAKQAADATKEIGTAADQSGSKLTGLSTAAKVAFAAAGVAAIRAGADAVQSAAHLADSQGAIEAVFGSSARVIEEWGGTAAQSAGLASSEVNDAAAVIGNSLQNAGFSADEAAEKTVLLTQRAADMASLMGTDVTQALGAVQSALRGEFDPIEKFTGGMNVAAVQAKALELGLVGMGGEMSQTAKTAATLELILSRSASSAGNFAREAEGVAGQQRQFRAEIENLKAEVGEQLLPVAAELLTVARDLAPEFADLAIEIASVVSALAPLVSAIGDTGSQFADSETGVIRWRSALLSGIPILGDLAEAQDDEVEAFVRARQATEEASAALDSHRHAAAGTKPAIRDLGDETAEADRKTRNFASALDEATRKQRESTAAYNEALSPITNAVGALNRMQEAHDTLIAVQADAEASTRDVRQAQLDYAESVFEAQGALDSIDSSKLEFALDGIARALGISSEEARELLRELGLLDGKTVTTVIRTRFEEVRDVRTNNVSPQDGGRYYGGGRAVGGYVTDQAYYTVGENGPETFVPNVPGTIIPAVSSSSYSTVNGGDQNITMIVPDATQVPQLASVLRSTHKLVGGGLRGGAR